MKKILLLVPAAALLVGACSDQPKFWRKSEIEEIAASQVEDFADAGSANVADELAGRISQLEQRIDDLEQEKRDLESRVSALEVNQY